MAGVVLDHEGRVLLLKHRFWTGNSWGLPSGYAERGETWEETFAREVHEETGLGGVVHLGEGLAQVRQPPVRRAANSCWR